MKKIYYLKTCSTCQRIIKALNLSKDFTQQDLKTTPISASDLEVLKSLSGSFEAMFSKRAKLYKEMGLKNKVLQEFEYESVSFRVCFPVRHQNSGSRHS